MNSPRPTRRSGGFSFIEILIVMGIISVLVGGVVVAIQMWVRRGPEFATKNTLNKTKILIENWKIWASFYPPGDVTKIPVMVGSGEKVGAPENSYNQGIESIYQALFWKGFKGAEFDSIELANVDDDKLRKPINKLNQAALLEIVDGWGNPLIYFNSADYNRFRDSPPSYMSKAPNGDEIDIEPVPWENDDGGFINPLTFQIFSCGEDGEPNTDDDVTTWTKSD